MSVRAKAKPRGFGLALVGISIGMALVGCSRAPSELVVYSARNEEHIKPIFDSFNFIYEGNAVARLDSRRGEKLAGKPVPSPHDFNFCLLHGQDEPDHIKDKLRAYYAACDAAHHDHGYTGLPEGQSPTLSEHGVGLMDLVLPSNA